MRICSKRFLILSGLLWSVVFDTNAQTVEHRIPSPESRRPTVIAAPARPVGVEALAALPIQEFRSLDLSREDHRSLGFPLLDVTATPFMTQSRLPLVQTPGGRVQANFFILSIHNKNLTQGPLVLPQTTQLLGQECPGDLYGIGLSFPLGRDTASAGSKSVWRGLSRVLRGK